MIWIYLGIAGLALELLGTVGLILTLSGPGAVSRRKAWVTAVMLLLSLMSMGASVILFVRDNAALIHF